MFIDFDKIPNPIRGKKMNKLKLDSNLFLFRIFLFLMFSLLSLSLSANIITVGPSGADYTKIQDAIDNANNGDEIIVSQGTYTENIDFKGKNITLRSTNPKDSNVVANTIIDGNLAGAVVTFKGTENETCVLSGFYITKGNSSEGNGIRGNYSKATIQNNVLYNNRGYSAAAICKLSGTIRNNTILNNRAGFYQCTGIIINNLIQNNTGYASYGFYDCDGTIINNTITNNEFYGIRYCDGFIINCIIWGNSTQVDNSSKPFYSCIQNWTGGGTGNTTLDPKFVDAPNGDFHLQSNSPCINSGNTFYLFGDYIADIDGECRISGSSVDMGSDEYNSSLDNDGDLLSDNDETTQTADLNNPDSDSDGLKDGIEVLRGTSPITFNTPPGYSVSHPLMRSIQQGIFFAFPDEDVTVSQGIYNESIHFMGKDLILQSSNPQDKNIVDTTIIDANNLFSVVYFLGNENVSCFLRGFTIRNGRLVPNGAGIQGNGTFASIENNIIKNNVIGGFGGGIYYCSGIIQNNIISNNSAMYGGGLSLCNGTIQNNIIHNNTVSGSDNVEYGGGLYNCNGLIQNNTIYQNTSGFRGGGLSNCGGTIRNCIIWQNTAPSGPQIYGCSTPTYSCIQDWTGGGTGNITSDPELVDPANGDYHLKNTSPCIDAGRIVVELTKDFEGDTRPFNGTPISRGDGSNYDIGADEYAKYTNADYWGLWE